MKKFLLNLYLAAAAILDRVALTRINPEAFSTSHKGSVKFSALVTDIKGKVGGSVFQGSKTGPVIKNKQNRNYIKNINAQQTFNILLNTWDGDMTSLMSLDNGSTAPDGSQKHIPDPRSPQTIIRSLSRQWSNLTAEERAAWVSAAPSFPFTNRYGESYTASGYQVFISINSRLIYMIGTDGFTAVPPDPSSGTVSDWDYSTISLSVDPIPLLLIPDGLPDGVTCFASILPPLPAGKLKVVFGGNPNPPRTIKVVGPKTASSQVALWAHRYGATPPGSVMNYQVFVIDNSNGKIIYIAQGVVTIPTLTTVNRFLTATGGIKPPGSGFVAEPAPTWVPGNRTLDFGEVPVDHDSNTLYTLLNGLQLTPNEVVTFTIGGANPVNFDFRTGTGTTILTSGTTQAADSLGNFTAFPIWCTFTPDVLGALSCTLTISGSSFTPIVLTFTGTGIA